MEAARSLVNPEFDPHEIQGADYERHLRLENYAKYLESDEAKVDEQLLHNERLSTPELYRVLYQAADEKLGSATAVKIEHPKSYKRLHLERDLSGDVHYIGYEEPELLAMTDGTTRLQKICYVSQIVVERGQKHIAFYRQDVGASLNEQGHLTSNYVGPYEQEGFLDLYSLWRIVKDAKVVGYPKLDIEP